MADFTGAENGDAEFLVDDVEAIVKNVRQQQLNEAVSWGDGGRGYRVELIETRSTIASSHDALARPAL
jgi:hypothetical protein